MLALLGSGEYLPPVEPIDRVLLSGLPEPRRVVCLPTAAGREGAERVAYWSDLGVAHFTRLGAEAEALPVLDRDSADDPLLAGRIRTANLVYLSGGDPGYLYKTLAGSRTWEAIRSVLAAGGVLAGCSAGAMVMGELLYNFPGWKHGFGLLPKVGIIPHFDEIPTWLITGIHTVTARRKILLGIDGSTALVVNDDQWRVMGRGGVTVIGKDGTRIYRDGEVIPTLS